MSPEESLLDPRLSGTIMRSDGIMLTLCGDPTQGLPDPTVELLCDLRQRIGRMVEVAR